MVISDEMIDGLIENGVLKTQDDLDDLFGKDGILKQQLSFNQINNQINSLEKVMIFV